MNIIKFKDSIRPGDTLFNTYLKGKYAYWVRMRYVVPFEVMSMDEYVSAEQSCCLGSIKGKYIDLLEDTELMAWVDELETDNINDARKYIQSNKFTTDPTLTTEQVKKFRAWLAKTLLNLDQTTSGTQKMEFYDEDFTHVLQYYANGMYDDVVKWLLKYGRTQSLNLTPSQTTNGCGCGSSNMDVTLAAIDVCNPLADYRRAIKSKMVEYFGDLNFWIQFSTSFLSEFKAYIDNIIRLNLLFINQSSTNFDDCSCGKSSGQLASMEILGRLTRALEYIITDDVVGNRNYISDAFKDWALDLYELMEW